MSQPTDNAIKPGMRFRRWEVIEFAGRYIKGKLQQDAWKCRCECARYGTVLRHNLLRGKSTQCGPCARGSRRVIPVRWRNLWEIIVKAGTVWQDIHAFLRWVGKQPLAKSRSLTITRRDETKPHGPGNSRLKIHREKWEQAIALIMSHRRATREAVLKWADTVSVSRVYAVAAAITTKRIRR